MINIDEVDKLSPALREVVENEINLLLKVNSCLFVHIYFVYMYISTP